ncbi:MAG TPA: hypothetical protein VGT06_03435 [Candidatus Methylomirabilis sp.]|jgi:hypothetical protein|nr:hypothetical protein [Candidatus Methylomirabilis sp.]
MRAWLEDYYLMAQMALLAPLLPYSAWVLLFLGTTLLGVGIWFRRQIRDWLTGLPRFVRKAVVVVLVLEAIPALAVGLGLTLFLGAAYGSRIGQFVMSLGGLLRATAMEKIGYTIGWIAGGAWGFVTGTLTMEVLAGLMVGILAYLFTKATGFPR